LPGVTSVEHEGTQVVVAGKGNFVQAVSTTLAQRGVIAQGLRVDQASLEDAYLDLTAQKLPIADGPPGEDT
jgi:ABC-2 type transport system ATP-binding protein